MTEDAGLNQSTLKFSLRFIDGSVFNLPDGWQEAFIIRLGETNKQILAVKKRMRYVTGKYYEHRAWPSKFDGLSPLPEGYNNNDDSRYECDDFYLEKWGEGRYAGLILDDPVTNPPAMAKIAEQLMYQVLRITLMQQALRDAGSNTRVISLDDLTSGYDVTAPEP